jgi:hypothetical protein
MLVLTGIGPPDERLVARSYRNAGFVVLQGPVLYAGRVSF